MLVSKQFPTYIFAPFEKKEVVIESIEKGTKWEEGKLVNDDDKVLEDENKSDSKVIIGVIQQIENNIHT